MRRSLPLHHRNYRRERRMKNQVTMKKISQTTTMHKIVGRKNQQSKE